VLRDATGRRLLVETLLPSGASCRHGVELEFPDRGWSELGPWSLEVLLPLAFFLKSKRLAQQRQILVYPRLLSSGAAAPSAAGGSRSLETFDDRGREGDVVQLRPYRDGDDTRQMHWKQTARQQRPIVVDRQRRAATPVLFVVDPRLSDPTDPALRARFERMVSEVATGVVRRLERGDPVGLVVGRTGVQPVPSPRLLGRLLRPLAEVQPQAANGRRPRQPALGAEALSGGGPGVTADRSYRQLAGLLLTSLLPMPFLYIVMPAFWLVAAAVGTMLWCDPGSLRLSPLVQNRLAIVIVAAVVAAGGARSARCGARPSAAAWPRFAPSRSPTAAPLRRCRCSCLCGWCP
jgi:hypothetical protein